MDIPTVRVTGMKLSKKQKLETLPWIKGSGTKVWSASSS